jgi:DedD protein
MSNYLDDDDLGRRRNEREVTLSTGSILGIFFGLALLCALFFGFGYNMGRKSSPTIPVATNSSETEPDSDSASTSPPVNANKPSAGSYVTAPVTNAPEAGADNTATPTVAATTKSTGLAAKPQSASAPPRAAVPASGSFGAGNFVVQVAAVSHQEDADLLVSALQRKGYSVAARNESADKLVHIQVGPFSDRKEADAMKTRLISDGYNAMIKQL